MGHAELLSDMQGLLREGTQEPRNPDPLNELREFSEGFNEGDPLDEGAVLAHDKKAHVLDLDTIGKKIGHEITALRGPKYAEKTKTGVRSAYTIEFEKEGVTHRAALRFAVEVTQEGFTFKWMVKDKGPKKTKGSKKS